MHKDYRNSNKIRKNSLSIQERPSKRYPQKRNKDQFQECSKSSLSPDQFLQKQQFDFAKELEEFGLETVIIEENTSSQDCQEKDTQNILSNLKCQGINKKEGKGKKNNIKQIEEGFNMKIKGKLRDVVAKLQLIKKENSSIKIGLSEICSSASFSMITLKNKIHQLVAQKQKLLQFSNSQKKSISQLLEHNEKLLDKIRDIEAKDTIPQKTNTLPQNSVQVKQLKHKYSTMMSQFLSEIQSLETEIHEMKSRQNQMNNNLVEWEKQLQVQQQQANQMMIELQLKEESLWMQRSELQKKQNQVHRLKTSVQMQEPDIHLNRKRTAHSKNQKNSKYFRKESISPKFISYHPQKIASQPSLHFQLSPTSFRQSSRLRTKNCLKTDRTCLPTDRIMSIQQNIKKDLQMMGYGY